MAKVTVKENLTIEFKSDLKTLPDNDIIDAVVAFANTEGGNLYLGVEDNGEITGLSKEHQDITRLNAFIANKTVPPVSTRVEYIDGMQPYLIISVPKCTAIVASSSGKISRRRIKHDGTPENVPLYPYEMPSRLSYLSLLDYSALSVNGATKNDLDPVERERIRNLLRTYRGDAYLLELDDEEFDKALHFATMKDGVCVPTYCGLLMIGKKESIQTFVPTMEISLQMMEGTKIRYNEDFSLPIGAAVEKIMNVFTSQNTHREVMVGPYRLDVFDYDERSFREALINSICHRDYTQLGRIRLSFTPEGLTITSPGGFIEGIRYDNLLDAEPHGRNASLADALKRIGLAERTGRGIDRIYEGSIRYGKPLPDYSNSTEKMVKLFIAKGEPDFSFTKYLVEEEKRLSRSFSVYALVILDALRRNKQLTEKEIISLTNLEKARLGSALQSLLESGSISMENEYYSLPYQLKENKKVISLEESEKMILAYVRKNKTVTRNEAENVTGLNSSQVYRLLNKLANKGEIYLEGKGKVARYHLKK